MNNDFKVKKIVSSILLCFFSLTLIFVAVNTNFKKTSLPMEQEGLEKLQYIKSKTVELSSLELIFRDAEEIENNELVILLEDLADDFMYSNEEYKYFAQDPNMIVIGSAVHRNWDAFKNAYIDFHYDEDLNKFIKAGESYYNNLNDTIKNVEKYIILLEKTINLYLVYLYSNIAILIILLIYKFRIRMLENNGTSKSKDKKTSFNCSKLPLGPIDLATSREVSILTFSAYSLENSDKSVIDDAMAIFMEALEDGANNLRINKPFIHKYNNTDIMVYLEKINYDTIIKYIGSVEEVITGLNDDNSNSFNISYIVGHSITTEYTQSITVQQLFDIAFGEMTNKMKEKEEVKEVKEEEKEVKEEIKEEVKEEIKEEVKEEIKEEVKEEKEEEVKEEKEEVKEEKVE